MAPDGHPLRPSPGEQRSPNQPSNRNGLCGGRRRHGLAGPNGSSPEADPGSGRFWAHDVQMTVHVGTSDPQPRSTGPPRRTACSRHRHTTPHTRHTRARTRAHMDTHLQSRAAPPGPPLGLVQGSGQRGGPPSLCHLLAPVATALPPAPPRGSRLGPKGTGGHTEVADAGQEQGDTTGNPRGRWLQAGGRRCRRSQTGALAGETTEQTPRTRARQPSCRSPDARPPPRRPLG